jgi:hypothetical protein
MVLLMNARGLDVAQAGAVFSVYGVVIVALELPTGGLADVAGRRAVLAASALFSVAGLALMAVATSVWPFVVAALFKGVARALSTRPAQAWYVDTLHAAEGPDADLRPGLAKGEAAGSASLCVSTLAGGALPLVVPGGLAAPMVGAAVAAGVLFAVVLVAMPEPPRPRVTIRSVLGGVPATVGTGLRMAVRDATLGRLLLVSFAVGVGLTSVELLTPGRFAALTGGAEAGSLAYAVVSAAGFGASALGAAAAPRVARLLGGSSAMAAVAGTVAGAVAFGALAASAVLPGSAGVVAACAAYVVIYGSMAVAEILRTAMMHGRVGSSMRATLMSVSSLQLSLGGVVGAPLLGSLASQAGTGAAWWAVATVLLLSALLYLRLPSPAAPPE